ncbi:DNA cytosine methyltransferase [Microvirga solisilvae]|uniref:DNA cytosine methyltransferase n=1 Tax=Microvirga solisilvae TaxID=2919498 RepID=UPI001FAF9C7D
MKKRGIKNKKSTAWPTVVDLFCGSGAVSEALKKRHFKVVAAIDNDPVACATYAANHPRVHLYKQDIRSVDPKTIRRVDLGGKDVDLLVVCAPCQPFSNQNRKREGDARADLILEAGRFARVLKPRLIFFENVPGLASPKNSELLCSLAEELGAEYQLGEPYTIDAADFGVPQRRVRTIMFAAPHRLPSLPKPLTPPGARITVRQALKGLSKLKAGERDPKDPLHAARNHQPIALKRLGAIPRDGGSRAALPRELELACHAKLSSKKYPDVYGRMRWNDVAPTLTTGCTDVTRGRFAHPEEDRAITLREAALLQTFPSQYHFKGNLSEIATQIGNAVPVALLEALIPTFRAAIAGNAI